MRRLLEEVFSMAKEEFERCLVLNKVYGVRSEDVIQFVSVKASKEVGIDGSNY